MNAGDRFTLTADAETLGLRERQVTDNQADFWDMMKRTKQRNHSKYLMQKPFLQILFRSSFEKDIRFSTLKTDGSNFQILVNNDDEGLPVRGAQLSTNAKTVILSTGLQEMGKTYVIKAEDLLDFSGKSFRKGGDVAVFLPITKHKEMIFFWNIRQKHQEELSKREKILPSTFVFRMPKMPKKNRMYVSMSYPPLLFLY